MIKQCAIQKCYSVPFSNDNNEEKVFISKTVGYQTVWWCSLFRWLLLVKLHAIKQGFGIPFSHDSYVENCVLQ